MLVWVITSEIQVSKIVNKIKQSVDTCIALSKLNTYWRKTAKVNLMKQNLSMLMCARRLRQIILENCKVKVEVKIKYLSRACYINICHKAFYDGMHVYKTKSMVSYDCLIL